jgi:tetrahydromethanopterin S-methyltransferase subunit G
MHLMRESWTDARLDDFRAEVDRRFGEVYRRFDEVERRFDEVDRRFDKVDKRFDKVEGEIHDLRSEMKTGFETIHRTMVQGIVALSASFIAGFAAIVTQL